MESISIRAIKLAKNGKFIYNILSRVCYDDADRSEHVSYEQKNETADFGNHHRFAGACYGDSYFIILFLLIQIFLDRQRGFQPAF